MSHRPRPAPWLLCAVLALLAGAVVGGIAGCRPGNGPQLTSVRFTDENGDGLPQSDETLLLTFDQDVSLVDGRATAGLALAPDGQRMGVYEIVPGPAAHQLLVRLRSGDASFRARGVHGHSDSPEASALSVDLHRIGVLDADGRRLSGVLDPIDIEPTLPPPPCLVRVDWVDHDNSFTVSAFDFLRLTFDREVELSPDARRDHRVPDDLFFLPAEGDRLHLADGDQGHLITSFRDDPDVPPEVIRLQLGHAPYLTVQGSFDPRERGLGSASGLAIDGTSIRPHPSIVDVFGTGVMSNQILDILGDFCEPFTLVHRGPFSGALTGHTATALPDGRVLVAGGTTKDPTTGLQIVDTAWIYDPYTDDWGDAIPMTMPRMWHTASYFRGPDNEQETPDDFVLLVGGMGGDGDFTSELASAEVFFPFGPQDQHQRFTLVNNVKGQTLSARQRHTVEILRGDLTRDRLLLVGGLGLNNTLNPGIEELEVLVAPADLGQYEVSLIVQTVGYMYRPRFLHDSLLLEDQRLFVFGGYGSRRSLSLPSKSVPVHEVRCQVLDVPEVLDLSSPEPPQSNQAMPLHPPPGGTHPAARRGHRLVRLPRSEDPVLLVGGTTRSPTLEGFAPDSRDQDSCRIAVRIELDVSAGRIRYRECGALMEEREGFETSTLDTGDVLLVGGRDRRGPSSRVELFNLDTEEIEPFCSSMHAPRQDFRMVKMLIEEDDALWLIVGGDPDGDRPAEVFRWERR